MKVLFTAKTLALLSAAMLGLAACSTTSKSSSDKAADADKSTQKMTESSSSSTTTKETTEAHEHHQEMNPSNRKTDKPGLPTSEGADKTAQRRGEMRELAGKATAMSMLSPTKDNTVEGRVFFIKEGDGVRVVANIRNLTPGEHGFHVHEKGDCSAPDGSSAGAHFNPDMKTHGHADPREHHMGDLGNLTADENGVARYDEVISGLSLEGPSSIIGKGLIVHAKADDLKTQPSGDAGGRVACGVISDAAEMKGRMGNREGGRRRDNRSEGTTGNSMTQ